MTWRRKDHRDNWLEVDREYCDDTRPCIVIDGYHLDASKLPEYVAALYASTGKPEPVILERPRYDSTTLIAGTRFSIRHGGVEITRYATEADSGSLCDPATIRAFAASLAILADEAEQEPDPAEVEELAALMDAEMERRANGQYGLYPAVARIALQWMHGRQQRGERS